MQRSVVVFCVGLFVGCSSPKETPRVEVEVVADSSALEPTVTDLGYEISVASADVAVRDIEFTIAGEVHSSLWDRVSSALVPSAFAHPGHYEGGDVTGEMLGDFVLRFGPGGATPLGTATLLVGDYHSVNFYFRRDESAELEGHTAIVRGTASRDEQEIEFEVALDSPEDRRLVGAPFEHLVEEGSKMTVGLRLLLLDPLEEDTLFDAVDFLVLDEDADGRVYIAPDSGDEPSVDAYNQIHRRFQSHDHFDAVARD